MQDLTEKIQQVIKKYYGEGAVVNDLKVSFKLVSDVSFEVNTSDPNPAGEKRRRPRKVKGKKRGPKPGHRGPRKNPRRKEVIAGAGADPLY